MSPLIIAVLVVVAVAIAAPAIFFGVRWWRHHTHQKLVEKHNEYFRALFPEGDEQKLMTRPLLVQTLKEVDEHIAFLEESKRRLERLAFISPLGVDFGLEHHSDLGSRVAKAKDIRKFVVQVGNQSGLGFVEQSEEEAETNATLATPTANAS